MAGPLRSVKRATDFLATATAKRDASSKALDESAARAAAALQQAALEAEPPAAARPAAAAAVGDPDAQPVAADKPPVLSHSGCSVDSGTAARLRCAVHPTADGGFAVKCGWSLRAGGVVSGSRAGVVQRDWRPSEGDWVGLFLLSEPAAEAVARAGDTAAQGAAAAAALTVPGRGPARDHWALEWASGDTSGAAAMTLPMALRERLADRPPRVVVAYVTSLDAVAGCAAPLELTGMGPSADGRARAALPADAPLSPAADSPADPPLGPAAAAAPAQAFAAAAPAQAFAAAAPAQAFAAAAPAQAATAPPPPPVAEPPSSPAAAPSPAPAGPVPPLRLPALCSVTRLLPGVSRLSVACPLPPLPEGRAAPAYPRPALHASATHVTVVAFVPSDGRGGGCGEVRGRHGHWTLHRATVALPTRVDVGSMSWHWVPPSEALWGTVVATFRLEIPGSVRCRQRHPELCHAGPSECASLEAQGLACRRCGAQLLRPGVRFSPAPSSLWSGEDFLCHPSHARQADPALGAAAGAGRAPHGLVAPASVVVAGSDVGAGSVRASASKAGAAMCGRCRAPVGRIVCSAELRDAFLRQESCVAALAAAAALSGAAPAGRQAALSLELDKHRLSAPGGGGPMQHHSLETYLAQAAALAAAEGRGARWLVAVGPPASATSRCVGVSVGSASLQLGACPPDEAACAGRPPLATLRSAVGRVCGRLPASLRSVPRSAVVLRFREWAKGGTGPLAWAAGRGEAGPRAAAAEVLQVTAGELSALTAALRAGALVLGSSGLAAPGASEGCGYEAWVPLPPAW